MMALCSDREGLRAQWADGTLNAADSARLSSHAAQCPACAGDAARQRWVHQALRARADLLREPAPEALRARIQGVLRPDNVVSIAAGRRAAAPTRSPVWRWVPRSAAAALLLAVSGLLLAGALGPRGVLLAAELALDHIKCRVIAAVDPSARPPDIERRWEAERGWAIHVPASAPDRGVTLLGLRTCLFHEGHMAHVMYDLRGQRLSLFVMPAGESPALDVDVFGQRAVSWAHRGRTYALVADADSTLPADVAAYFEAEAR